MKKFCLYINQWVVKVHTDPKKNRERTIRTKISGKTHVMTTPIHTSWLANLARFCKSRLYSDNWGSPWECNNPCPGYDETKIGIHIITNERSSRLKVDFFESTLVIPDELFPFVLGFAVWLTPLIYTRPITSDVDLHNTWRENKKKKKIGGTFWQMSKKSCLGKYNFYISACAAHVLRHTFILVSQNLAIDHPFAKFAYFYSCYAGVGFDYYLMHTMCTACSWSDWWSRPCAGDSVLMVNWKCLIAELINLNLILI